MSSYPRFFGEFRLGSLELLPHHTQLIEALSAAIADTDADINTTNERFASDWREAHYLKRRAEIIVERRRERKRMKNAMRQASVAAMGGTMRPSNTNTNANHNNVSLGGTSAGIGSLAATQNNASHNNTTGNANNNSQQHHLLPPLPQHSRRNSVAFSDINDHPLIAEEGAREHLKRMEWDDGHEFNPAVVKQQLLAAASLRGANNNGGGGADGGGGVSQQSNNNNNNNNNNGSNLHQYANNNGASASAAAPLFVPLGGAANNETNNNDLGGVIVSDSSSTSSSSSDGEDESDTTSGDDVDFDDDFDVDPSPLNFKARRLKQKDFNHTTGSFVVVSPMEKDDLGDTFVSNFGGGGGGSSLPYRTTSGAGAGLSFLNLAGSYNKAKGGGGLNNTNNNTANQNNNNDEYVEFRSSVRGSVSKPNRPLTEAQQEALRRAAAEANLSLSTMHGGIIGGGGGGAPAAATTLLSAGGEFNQQASAATNPNGRSRSLPELGAAVEEDDDWTVVDYYEGSNTQKKKKPSPVRTAAAAAAAAAAGVTPTADSLDGMESLDGLEDAEDRHAIANAASLPSPTPPGTTNRVGGGGGNNLHTRNITFDSNNISTGTVPSLTSSSAAAMMQTPSLTKTYGGSVNTNRGGTHAFNSASASPTFGASSSAAANNTNDKFINKSNNKSAAAMSSGGGTNVRYAVVDGVRMPPHYSSVYPSYYGTKAGGVGRTLGSQQLYRSAGGIGAGSGKSSTHEYNIAYDDDLYENDQHMLASPISSGGGGGAGGKPQKTIIRTSNPNQRFVFGGGPNPHLPPRPPESIRKGGGSTIADERERLDELLDAGELHSATEDDDDDDEREQQQQQQQPAKPTTTTAAPTTNAQSSSPALGAAAALFTPPTALLPTIPSVDIDAISQMSTNSVQSAASASSTTTRQTQQNNQQPSRRSSSQQSQPQSNQNHNTTMLERKPSGGTQSSMNVSGSTIIANSTLGGGGGNNSRSSHPTFVGEVGSNGDVAPLLPHSNNSNLIFTSSSSGSVALSKQQSPSPPPSNNSSRPSAAAAGGGGSNNPPPRQQHQRISSHSQSLHPNDGSHTTAPQSLADPPAPSSVDAAGGSGHEAQLNLTQRARRGTSTFDDGIPLTAAANANPSSNHNSRAAVVGGADISSSSPLTALPIQLQLDRSVTASTSAAGGGDGRSTGNNANVTSPPATPTTVRPTTANTATSANNTAAAAANPMARGATFATSAIASTLNGHGGDHASSSTRRLSASAGGGGASTTTTTTPRKNTRSAGYNYAKVGLDNPNDSTPSPAVERGGGPKAYPSYSAWRRAGREELNNYGGGGGNYNDDEDDAYHYDAHQRHQQHRHSNNTTTNTNDDALADSGMVHTPRSLSFDRSVDQQQRGNFSLGDSSQKKRKGSTANASPSKSNAHNNRSQQNKTRSQMAKSGDFGGFKFPEENVRKGGQKPTVAVAEDGGKESHQATFMSGGQGSIRARSAAAAAPTSRVTPTDRSFIASSLRSRSAGNATTTSLGNSSSYGSARTDSDNDDPFAAPTMRRKPKQHNKSKKKDEDEEKKKKTSSSPSAFFFPEERVTMGQRLSALADEEQRRKDLQRQAVESFVESRRGGGGGTSVVSESEDFPHHNNTYGSIEGVTAVSNNNNASLRATNPNNGKGAKAPTPRATALGSFAVVNPSSSAPAAARTPSVLGGGKGGRSAAAAALAADASARSPAMQSSAAAPTSSANNKLHRSNSANNNKFAGFEWSTTRVDDEHFQMLRGGGGANNNNIPQSTTPPGLAGGPTTTSAETAHGYSEHNHASKTNNNNTNAAMNDDSDYDPADEENIFIDPSEIPPPPPPIVSHALILSLRVTLVFAEAETGGGAVQSEDTYFLVDRRDVAALIERYKLRKTLADDLWDREILPDDEDLYQKQLILLQKQDIPPLFAYRLAQQQQAEEKRWRAQNDPAERFRFFSDIEGLAGDKLVNLELNEAFLLAMPVVCKNVSPPGGATAAGGGEKGGPSSSSSPFPYRSGADRVRISVDATLFNIPTRMPTRISLIMEELQRAEIERVRHRNNTIGHAARSNSNKRSGGDGAIPEQAAIFWDPPPLSAAALKERELDRARIAALDAVHKYVAAAKETGAAMGEKLVKDLMLCGVTGQEQQQQQSSSDGMSNAPAGGGRGVANANIKANKNKHSSSSPSTTHPQSNASKHKEVDLNEVVFHLDARSAGTAPQQSTTITTQVTVHKRKAYRRRVAIGGGGGGGSVSNASSAALMNNTHTTANNNNYHHPASASIGGATTGTTTQYIFRSSSGGASSQQSLPISGTGSGGVSGESLVGPSPPFSTSSPPIGHNGGGGATSIAYVKDRRRPDKVSVRVSSDGIGWDHTKEENFTDLAIALGAKLQKKQQDEMNVATSSGNEASRNDDRRRGGPSSTAAAAAIPSAQLSAPMEDLIDDKVSNLRAVLREGRRLKHLVGDSVAAHQLRVRLLALDADDDNEDDSNQKQKSNANNGEGEAGGGESENGGTTTANTTKNTSPNDEGSNDEKSSGGGFLFGQCIGRSTTLVPVTNVVSHTVTDSSVTVEHKEHGNRREVLRVGTVEKKVGGGAAAANGGEAGGLLLSVSAAAAAASTVGGVTATEPTRWRKTTTTTTTTSVTTATKTTHQQPLTSILNTSTAHISFRIASAKVSLSALMATESSANESSSPNKKKGGGNEPTMGNNSVPVVVNLKPKLSKGFKLLPNSHREMFASSSRPNAADRNNWEADGSDEDDDNNDDEAEEDRRKPTRAGDANRLLFNTNQADKAATVLLHFVPSAILYPTSAGAGESETAAATPAGTSGADGTTPPSVVTQGELFAAIELVTQKTVKNNNKNNNANGIAPPSSSTAAANPSSEALISLSHVALAHTTGILVLVDVLHLMHWTRPHVNMTMILLVLVMNQILFGVDCITGEYGNRDNGGMSGEGYSAASQWGDIASPNASSSSSSAVDLLQSLASSFSATSFYAADGFGDSQQANDHYHQSANPPAPPTHQQNLRVLGSGLASVLMAALSSATSLLSWLHHQLATDSLLLRCLEACVYVTTTLIFTRYLASRWRYAQHLHALGRRTVAARLLGEQRRIFEEVLGLNRNGNQNGGGGGGGHNIKFDFLTGVMGSICVQKSLQKRIAKQAKKAAAAVEREQRRQQEEEQQLLVTAGDAANAKRRKSGKKNKSKGSSSKYGEDAASMNAADGGGGGKRRRPKFTFRRHYMDVSSSSSSASSSDSEYDFNPFSAGSGTGGGGALGDAATSAASQTNPQAAALLRQQQLEKQQAAATAAAAAAADEAVFFAAGEFIPTRHTSSTAVSSYHKMDRLYMSTYSSMNMPPLMHLMTPPITVGGGGGGSAPSPTVGSGGGGAHNLAAHQQPHYRSDPKPTFLLDSRQYHRQFNLYRYAAALEASARRYLTLISLVGVAVDTQSPVITTAGESTRPAAVAARQELTMLRLMMQTPPRRLLVKSALTVVFYALSLCCGQWALLTLEGLSVTLERVCEGVDTLLATTSMRSTKAAMKVMVSGTAAEGPPLALHAGRGVLSGHHSGHAPLGTHDDDDANSGEDHGEPATVSTSASIPLLSPSLYSSSLPYSAENRIVDGIASLAFSSASSSPSFLTSKLQQVDLGTHLGKQPTKSTVELLANSVALQQQLMPFTPILLACPRLFLPLAALSIEGFAMVGIVAIKTTSSIIDLFPHFASAEEVVAVVAHQHDDYAPSSTESLHQNQNDTTATAEHRDEVEKKTVVVTLLTPTNIPIGELLFATFLTLLFIVLVYYPIMRRYYVFMYYYRNAKRSLSAERLALEADERKRRDRLRRIKKERKREDAERGVREKAERAEAAALSGRGRAGEGEEHRTNDDRSSSSSPASPTMALLTGKNSKSGGNGSHHHHHHNSLSSFPSLIVNKLKAALHIPVYAAATVEEREVMVRHGVERLRESQRRQREDKRMVAWESNNRRRIRILRIKSFAMISHVIIRWGVVWTYYKLSRLHPLCLPSFSRGFFFYPDQSTPHTRIGIESSDDEENGGGNSSNADDENEEEQRRRREQQQEQRDRRRSKKAKSETRRIARSILLSLGGVCGTGWSNNLLVAKTCAIIGLSLSPANSQNVVGGRRSGGRKQKGENGGSASLPITAISTLLIFVLFPLRLAVFLTRLSFTSFASDANTLPAERPSSRTAAEVDAISAIVDYKRNAYDAERQRVLSMGEEEEEKMAEMERHGRRSGKKKSSKSKSQGGAATPPISDKAAWRAFKRETAAGGAETANAEGHFPTKIKCLTQQPTTCSLHPAFYAACSIAAVHATRRHFAIPYHYNEDRINELLRSEAEDEDDRQDEFSHHRRRQRQQAREEQLAKERRVAALHNRMTTARHLITIWDLLSLHTTTATITNTAMLKAIHQQQQQRGKKRHSDYQQHQQQEEDADVTAYIVQSSPFEEDYDEDPSDVLFYNSSGGDGDNNKNKRKKYSSSSLLASLFTSAGILSRATTASSLAPYNVLPRPAFGYRGAKFTIKGLLLLRLYSIQQWQHRQNVAHRVLLSLFPSSSHFHSQYLQNIQHMNDAMYAPHHNTNSSAAGGGIGGNNQHNGGGGMSSAATTSAAQTQSQQQMLMIQQQQRGISGPNNQFATPTSVAATSVPMFTTTSTSNANTNVNNTSYAAHNATTMSIRGGNANNNNAFSPPPTMNIIAPPTMSMTSPSFAPNSTTTTLLMANGGNVGVGRLSERMGGGLFHHSNTVSGGGAGGGAGVPLHGAGYQQTSFYGSPSMQASRSVAGGGGTISMGVGVAEDETDSLQRFDSGGHGSSRGSLGGGGGGSPSLGMSGGGSPNHPHHGNNINISGGGGAGKGEGSAHYDHLSDPLGGGIPSSSNHDGHSAAAVDNNNNHQHPPQLVVDIGTTSSFPLLFRSSGVHSEGGGLLHAGPSAHPHHPTSPVIPTYQTQRTYLNNNNSSVAAAATEGGAHPHHQQQQHNNTNANAPTTVSDAISATAQQSSEELLLHERRRLLHGDGGREREMLDLGPKHIKEYHALKVSQRALRERDQQQLQQNQNQNQSSQQHSQQQHLLLVGSGGAEYRSSTPASLAAISSSGGPSSGHYVLGGAGGGYTTPPPASSPAARGGAISNASTPPVFSIPFSGNLQQQQGGGSFVSNAPISISTNGPATNNSSVVNNNVSGGGGSGTTPLGGSRLNATLPPAAGGIANSNVLLVGSGSGGRGVPSAAINNTRTESLTTGGMWSPRKTSLSASVSPQPNRPSPPPLAQQQRGAKAAFEPLGGGSEESTSTRSPPRNQHGYPIS